MLSASKSVGLIPVSAIEVRFNAAMREFVRVTASGAEIVLWRVVGKAGPATLSLTEGAAVPVPVRHIRHLCFQTKNLGGINFRIQKRAKRTRASEAG